VAHPSGLIARLALLLMLSVLLAGCGGNVALLAATADAPADPAPSLTPFLPLAETPNEVPSPSLPPTAVPSATIPAAPAIPEYTLHAVLDYAAHRLMVDEGILYPNASPASLTALVLAVEANRWTGGFHLDWITAGGDLVTPVLAGSRLDLALPAPLAPGASLTLALHYELILPQADTKHVYGYNARQANLVDWYPFVVPYLPGQRWLLHTPEPVGEYLVYPMAAFDVSLDLADPAQPVVIAASAPLEPAGQGWHASVSRARTFAFSASPEYQSESLPAGAATVTSYFFPAEKTAGEAVLQAVAQALVTYGEKFGVYPHASLSIVEALFNDGLETDGLFFLSQGFYTRYDGTPLNYLIDIGVHETAHQWWFALVGNDQALEPWLDEAMATYSEHIFYEFNYPGVTAWRQFRIDPYDPTGWVDTDIYHGGGYRPYVNAVYLRGALFLQALRDRVGDPAFFAFLQDYVGQMGGKIATADDFFRILRLHTGADLTDLTGRYFQHPH